MLPYNVLINFGWSKNKIAKLFQVDHKAIEKQLSLPIEYNPNGRPAFLQPDEVDNLLFKGQYFTINLYYDNTKLR